MTVSEGQRCSVEFSDDEQLYGSRWRFTFCMMDVAFQVSVDIEILKDVYKSDSNLARCDQARGG